MMRVHQRTCLCTQILCPFLKEKSVYHAYSNNGQGECIACAVTHFYVAGDVNYGLIAQAAVGPTLPPESREDH
jgi:hypothetical protein